jgi:hypothetical protein
MTTISQELTTTQQTLPEPGEDQTLRIAEYMVNIPDGKKAAYLSFRISGFGIRESAQLTGVHQNSVSRWRREDEYFAHLDGPGLREARKNLAVSLAEIEFIRNFRLVMHKDYIVLTKSVLQPDELTTSEERYLSKLRAYYTPQQLEVLRQLSSGEDGKPASFTDFLLMYQRTQGNGGVVVGRTTGKLQIS